MVHTPALRLLAPTNNARGDLFTRLAKDLFFALGYDDLRLDVHQAGREVDVVGVHRHEPRDLVAECKAHEEPMGGRELNTFLGVLTRERDKRQPRPVSGYFVSLNGFRETGIEQERATSPQNSVILVDGAQMVEELEKARVIVSRAQAIEHAGRVAAEADTDAVFETTELLGHERGYLWAVYFSAGKERTHFALIHADGTALADSIARDVVKADKKSGGRLHELQYLAPPRDGAKRVALGKAAVDRYRKWLGEECGFIQLDGLPADTDLSATRMKLERLFVPLKVVRAAKKKDTEEVVSVGEILSSEPHLAIIAKPGGGKSTLLKRLATAYSDPSRLRESDDGLPDRKWLPLFLRCRELRDRIQRPILELLDDLPQHAGMNAGEANAFREGIHEALRSGEALLLVDGLDEVSDEGARQTFAQHLRTLLAMFPQAALVVTSREAGFRLVAGVVASVCFEVRLAPFDEKDVSRLCEAWHVEVVANNEKVRADARSLAATIWENERIRALAENPLMLTTLLVVKRSIGDLPNRRVELYREAVRVLVRTWNTEGFVPLDLDEALAQLSYVACSMLQNGQQQIAHKPLLKLLQEARRELEAELQFTRIGAAEFIERIEYRSSLLMQTGHASVDGELQPVYEFRHLTFQEYLAARGFVEEQYPGRNAGKTLTELLEPHFKDETWREVIPLAAVLAGRKAEPLIQRLTALCADFPLDSIDRRPAAGLLLQCLLDEVSSSPETLRPALKQVTRGIVVDATVRLRRGKFGSLLESIVMDAYFGSNDWDDYHEAAIELLVPERYGRRSPQGTSDSLMRALSSGNRLDETGAAFGIMYAAWFAQDHRPTLTVEEFQSFREVLGMMIDPTDGPRSLAVAWAFAWIGQLPNLSPTDPAILISLYRLWRSATTRNLKMFASWAFGAQPVLPRDTFDPNVWGDDCDACFAETNEYANELSRLMLGWYRRKPWNDEEMAQIIQDRLSSLVRVSEYDSRNLSAMLEMLGEPGQRALADWKKRKEPTR
jgi:hypothetical protein